MFVCRSVTPDMWSLEIQKTRLWFLVLLSCLFCCAVLQVVEHCKSSILKVRTGVTSRHGVHSRTGEPFLNYYNVPNVWKFWNIWMIWKCLDSAMRANDINISLHSTSQSIGSRMWRVTCCSTERNISAVSPLWPGRDQSDINVVEAKW